MDSEIARLEQLITNSRKVLITSHISPDPDAVCSALLMGVTLAKNYPDKTVIINLEERPSRGLEFLPGYGDIKFGPLLEQVQELRPELLILVDANRYDRCTREGAKALKDYIHSQGENLKTVIIDHHEPDDKDQTDVYINQGSPATTQDVYELCFDQLKLEKPSGYETVVMLGVISDSARFKYVNPRHQETFKLVSELLDKGVSIEELENRLNQYTEDQMKVFAELAKNLDHEENYTYTFISDDFAKSWQDQGKSIEDFKIGCEIFTNDYIRNIGGRKWGFVVYPELGVPGRIFGISLRSLDGSVDVSAIARDLGGGGHKPAAGAKIGAASVQDALAKAKEAVKASLSL